MSSFICQILFLIFLMAILPFASALTTNSTYVAGTGEAIIYFSLNGILLLFLIGCFILLLTVKHLLVKVFSIGTGYLLLIAISFIGWQMANDFLTSAFLISILRIIFFVLVIGLFPLIIGGFGWYLYMIFKIKEIQRLMEKGFSLEDANRRTGRKYK